MEFECLPVLCKFGELFTLQLSAIVSQWFRIEEEISADPRALSLCGSSLLVLCLENPCCLSFPELQSLSPWSFKTFLLCLAASSLVQGGRRIQDLPNLFVPFWEAHGSALPGSHCLKAAVSYILSSFLVLTTGHLIPGLSFIRGWQAKSPIMFSG